MASRHSEDNIGLVLILGASAYALYKYFKDKGMTSVNVPGTVTNSGSSSVLLGEAKGIRNNNPGNIRYSVANNWTGQVANEGGFVRFDTPQNGFRAMFKLLKAYKSSYGLDTIAKIGNRWAPSSENNTASWVSNVAINSGIGQNTALNVNDRTTMINIGRGITVAENGSKYKNYYNAAVIGAGFDAS